MNQIPALGENHIWLLYAWNPIPGEISELFTKKYNILFQTMTFFENIFGSVSKESSCSAEDLGLIPGLGRLPGGGHGNSLQYCCLENPHGQRSLADYSPWGHKESDTTQQLSTFGSLKIK